MSLRTSSIKPSLSLPSRLQVHPSRSEDNDEGGHIYNNALPGMRARTGDHNKNRREWMEQSASRWGVATAATASASLLRPTPATAATTPTLTPNPPTTTTAAGGTKPSSALCDPSVSTLTKKNRTVHILGTAHISSESAQLAGRLVREVTPLAVFLELDQKRVARAKVGGESVGSELVEAPVERTVAGGGRGGGTTLDTSNTITPELEPTRSTAVPKTNPFDLRERAMQASSKLVGKSIQSLYSKLESDGFDAGEEFAIAAREGLTLGSTIVLGDQDVEITLRRLTEALGRTDFKRLLAADSELELSMQSMVTEGGVLASSPGSGGGKDGEPQMTKEQFTSFIETMKAKENVRLLMGNLKAVAPEIYGAMIGERDAYMAAGLNNLNQFDSTVAVMGIAHVDGVEKNLQANGWVVVPATCPMRV